jgi:hypothetical protein
MMIHERNATAGVEDDESDRRSIEHRLPQPTSLVTVAVAVSVLARDVDG